MEFIKYPSIEQFRNIVKSIRRNSEYHEVPYPKLKFNGTVKLHGTNGGIGWDGEKLWCQSRNNILDVNNTNSGFYTYVMGNLSYFSKILDNVLGDNDQVILFGEWCGNGIQKGVALSELDKMFVSFGLLKTKDGNNSWDVGSLSNFENKDLKLFNSEMFDEFEIIVDFENPKFSQNDIAGIVDYVENECPVGKYFGVSGIGEGVVFSCEYNGKYYSFKAKGQKHSVSKVKKVASIDIEKLDSVVSFAEYAVTENRVLQAVKEVDAKEVKDVGKVIKWVMTDIAKEELDVLVGNGLSLKDVQSKCCNAVRNLFFDYLDKNI